MSKKLIEDVKAKLNAFRDAGTFKETEVLESPQAPDVKMTGRGDVLVMSSNNYLGLSNHPAVTQAAKEAVDEFGAGTASVRFICGTLSLHHALEKTTAAFLGFEKTTTYMSCWNANEAVFPTLLGEGDAIFSDALNHASIIDGLRLVKRAEKNVYGHSNMEELEAQLKKAGSAKNRMIVTDGVFSMEGDLARLPEICDLAEKYDALVCVDDSHATGVLGKTGRGTAEHFDCQDRVDILTGTYGKALGGAAGGFVAGPSSLVEYLVQQSRPQLFSNALPPAVAASAKAAIELLDAEPERVQTLRENATYFRHAVKDLGLKPLEGETPIVPIILGETKDAIAASKLLLEEGVFVTGFGFPVVPKGEARLRIQISAAHTREHLDRALRALGTVGKKLNFI